MRQTEKFKNALSEFAQYKGDKDLSKQGKEQERIVQAGIEEMWKNKADICRIVEEQFGVFALCQSEYDIQSAIRDVFETAFRDEVESNLNI